MACKVLYLEEKSSDLSPGFIYVNERSVAAGMKGLELLGEEGVKKVLDSVE